MTTGIYKFAGKTVAVTSLYPDVQDHCAEYRTDDAPDFTVEISRADIDSEAEKTRREYESEGKPEPRYSPGQLEKTAVYRKIAEQLIEYDRIVFHGSCVAVDGQGYLFTAKSGTGKSTHAELWKELLGDRAVNVNDDKPILHITESGVTVYGTPFRGKERRGCNTAVPLKALCLLEQSAENHITPVTKEQAYPLLVQQAYRSPDPGKLMRTLALVDRLARNVRLYRLGCNMELSAAATAWKAMKGNKDMKLNSDFLVHEDGDTKFVVSTGVTEFNGIARGNATAGFIIDCLRSDTTEDEIVAKMRENWDVSDELARRDVRKIVDQLKSIGAIVE